MTEPIEESYFDWLCAKAIPIDVNVYYDLMEILYRTEFVWFVPGDRNRAEDGKELRLYFLNETGLDRNDLWFDEPCSVLELLIAFAGRASFQTDMPVRDWFWIFMDNLDLDEYMRVSDEDRPLIEEILNTFVWRTYDYSGYGGLFPLEKPEEDQCKVETWYQFCAWVDEKELV